MGKMTASISSSPVSPGLSDIWCCEACNGTILTPNPLRGSDLGNNQIDVSETLELYDQERCIVCRFQHHVFGKPASYQEFLFASVYVNHVDGTSMICHLSCHLQLRVADTGFSYFNLKMNISRFSIVRSIRSGVTAATQSRL